MPHKCSVVNCRSGCIGGPAKAVFPFPRNADLRQRWFTFLNRDGISITSSSRSCIDHFESKYLLHHSYKKRLNMSLNPIPTIHPSSTHQSQAIISKSIRKSPTKRVLQPDQLNIFKTRFVCSDFDDVERYISYLSETY